MTNVAERTWGDIVAYVNRNQFLRLLFLALSVAVIATGTALAYDWLTVTRVVDGDTIVLEDGQKVRLIGVDTPETVDPRKPVQYFGKEASAFTKSELEGKRVRLEYDWERTDKYGRTLAFVYQEDGSLFNAKLISSGYAHAYTKYPFKQEFMDLFRQLERDARENGRGLWAGDSTAISEASTGPTLNDTNASPQVVKQQGKYWINTRSGVRHNASCRWFGKTSQGHYTDELEGRACGMCGG